ncbi:MAG: phosphate signaling complex protein PhoU [Planctomycetes bacterium]|nr:phosphate signaling complex protein PhoU [Planctomycetota bacterium]
MTKHLQRDLEVLKKQLLTMGGMVEQATDLAISAVIDRRRDLAEQVLRGDDAIDLKELEVEDECLKMLALHQPVATDLRFIITVLKVNNDLERMGDLAKNIAERAAVLCEQPPIAGAQDFRRMAERVRNMVHECIDALVERDVDLARRVCLEDKEVDDENRRRFADLQQVMQSDPSTVERAVSLLSVSRHLERIADHATNVAEDVVFLVDGEVIRHLRLARASAP